MVLGLLSIFLVICTSAVSAEETQQFQFIEDLEDLSDVEKEFVELARKHQGVHQLGDLFVISLGEQPNPGYGLTLEKQSQLLEQLQLHLKRTYPQEGISYPQVISYPYLMGRVDLPPQTTLSVFEGGKKFAQPNTDQLVFEETRFIGDTKKQWTVLFNQPITAAILKKIDISVITHGEEIHPIQVKVNPKNRKEVIIQTLEEYEKEIPYLLKVENNKNIFVVPFEVRNELELEYDFNDGLHGWKGNFSDLPVEYDQNIYLLDTGHRSIPLMEKILKKGLFFSGMNRSDDLFMYAKKKLTTENGLLPNHTYQLNMEINFYTNVSPGLIGIGGAPGESVYVKAGASTIEPKTVQVDGELRMNIDKGGQSSSGKDAVLIGNIAQEQKSAEQYKLKQLKTAKPLTVKTNADGELWVLFGTDSGFEGLTSIFYSNVKLTLIDLGKTNE